MLQEIKGSLNTLAGRSTAQNERMTEAVKLMQKMAVWLGEVFPQLKEKRQPSPGSSSQQQLPPPSKPSVASHVFPALTSVPVKKPLSRHLVITEEEAPASPTKKKVKVNLPSYSTQVQQRPSRTGLAKVRMDLSIIRTGHGKTRKDQTTGVIATKGTSPAGTTGARVIKGTIMCRHIRGTPPETIRISSMHTKGIKGQRTSSTTVKEVRVIIAQIREADRAIIRGQVQTSRTTNHRGTWMRWYMT